MRVMHFHSLYHSHHQLLGFFFFKSFFWSYKIGLVHGQVFLTSFISMMLICFSNHNHPIYSVDP